MELKQNQIEHSSSALPQAKTTSNRYNYNLVLQFIATKAKQLYGSRFQLCERDKQIVINLAAYFLRDEEICTSQKIDLEKGIMLTGPIGCGKTSLMTIMRFVAARERSFTMKSTRDVSFEFISEGYDVIHRYCRGKLYQSEYRSYCFDDLGTENNIKYFGNECNVMAEILLSRYDLFIAKGLITHITTNLSAPELEQAYGNRLRSRLREMVNLVGFDKDVADKRR